MAVETVEKITHKLRGAQYELSEMSDREILICGPSGSGTDRACLEKLMAQALLHPGAQLLVVRKVAKTIVTSAQATLKREVLPELIANGNCWFQNGNRETPTGYVFSNGSMIAMEGMDDPRKILGSRWDMIYAQMATDLELEDWENLLLTLTPTPKTDYTQLMADCLPQWPTHWLKLRADSGKTTYLESRLEDNPTLFRKIGPDDFTITLAGQDHLARLNDLTGVRRHRNKDGIWAVADGLVYPMWDPKVHMVRQFNPPPDWAHVWGIDWGYKNPLTWQNWVREPDGRLILVQEIYMTGMKPDHLAEEVWRLTRDQPREEWIVSDHDPEKIERFRTRLGELRRAEVEVRLAKKDVKIGIEAVCKRYKRRDIAIMHGCLQQRDPELVKMSKPTCLAEEKASYVWGDATQTFPSKHDDHGNDAERYVVMEEDSVAGARVRMRRG